MNGHSSTIVILRSKISPFYKKRVRSLGGKQKSVSSRVSVSIGSESFSTLFVLEIDVIRWDSMDTLTAPSISSDGAFIRTAMLGIICESAEQWFETKQLYWKPMLVRQLQRTLLAKMKLYPNDLTVWTRGLGCQKRPEMSSASVYEDFQGGSTQP